MIVNPMKHFILLSIVIFFAACHDDSSRLAEEISPDDSTAAASDMDGGDVVDAFYAALTGRDSAGLVSMFHPEGRLLGTDPAEDWGMEEIKSYMSERLRDTTSKTVFNVTKRTQREWEGTTVVVDVIELSTLKVPFRVVTLVRTEQDGPCIVLSEFSALVPNAKMDALEQVLQSDRQ